MARQRSRSTELQPVIRRARLEQVVIYEVSDSELELLAHGFANATYLNFAIALLSAAVSFFIALVTTHIDSQRTFIVFVVLTSVGAVAGTVLLVIWYRNSQSVADLLQTIKNRLPPEGVPESPSQPPV